MKKKRDLRVYTLIGTILVSFIFYLGCNKKSGVESEDPGAFIGEGIIHVAMMGQYTPDSIHQLLNLLNTTLPFHLAHSVKAYSVQYLTSDPQHNETDVLAAIQANMLLDWAPEAPIRFFHGDADDVVPDQNAVTAVDTFTANGVTLFYVVPFLSAQTSVDKIAFHSNRSGSNEIYLMNTDGSKVKQLTRNSVDDLCPVISPDGSKIAFLSNSDGKMKIYILHLTVDPVGEPSTMKA